MLCLHVQHLSEFGIFQDMFVKLFLFCINAGQTRWFVSKWGALEFDACS